MEDAFFSDDDDISIHTLAWRVTAFVAMYYDAKHISIHTLAWRVTHE